MVGKLKDLVNSKNYSNCALNTDSVNMSKTAKKCQIDKLERM